MSTHTYYTNPFKGMVGSEEPLVIFTGTMGGAAAGTGNYDFPYSGRNNKLWCRLPAAFGDKSLVGCTKEDKLDFLKRHRLALLDVCESGYRIGSSDGTIKDEKVNDFNSIKERFPDIKIVCLGSDAYKLFNKHFSGFDVRTAYSTSGCAAGISCEQGVQSMVDAIIDIYPDLKDAKTSLDTVCKYCEYGHKFTRKWQK